MTTILQALMQTSGFLLGLICLAAILLLPVVYITGVAFLPVAGYSFGRVVARLLGFGTASDEQFHKACKRLVMCAALYAFLFVAFYVLASVLMMSGAMDGPG